MHPQRTGDNLFPPLGSLHLGGILEIFPPQRNAAGVSKNGTLIDVEHAGLGGVRARVLNLLAGATLLAEALEVELPGDVGLEVVRLAARAEDGVFMLGAFGNKCADFFLQTGNEY